MTSAMSMDADKAANNSQESVETGEAQVETMPNLLDWYLDGHNDTSLKAMQRKELVSLCHARGLETEGVNKMDLIDALLHWVTPGFIGISTSHATF